MEVYIEIAAAIAALLLLSRIVAGVPDERVYRRATVFIGVLLVCVALMILTIGARSPYTHANLSAGYDPRYDRTAQIGIGDDTSFMGVSPQAAPTAADPVARGAHLYVTEGCVTCHGLEGRGAPVGPAIVGQDIKTITQRLRQGPGGMPQFSPDGLTDQEIADITAYLASMVTTK
jgi:cytochrome c553